MKALITGAGGFLGSAVCRMLLAKDWEVNGIARSHYPALIAAGVTMHQGDICEYAAVEKAAEGCDLIIHTAAKAGVWGSYASYHSVNVIGTENIIKACRDLQINKLVYTSTPSVTFAGKDEDGVNEQEPYADTYLCHYAHTKKIAEEMVLKANDSDLATCALRPHLIWGPGDPHLVPRVIERAKAGRLRLVGDGSKLVDSTYIDNAASAHIAAAEKLNPEAACAGKAYYISNDKPIIMADLLNKILEAGGLPPVTKTISPGLAYFAGLVMEGLYTILGKKSEPIMTRFVARQLSTAHWFDISAAKTDFGYSPHVNIETGMQLLADSLK